MIIYVNGDSHSAGVSLESKTRSFGSLVAQHFRLPVENQSLPGASNNYIIRITQDWIRTCNDKYFVLIGWSSWEREEWPYRGGFFQANSSADTFGDADLDQRYKTWVNALDETSVPKLGKHWHEQIWQFHEKLKTRNIPHLFFNCFYDFFVDQTQHRDWDNCFLRPYDSQWSYWHYLKSQGYNTINANDLHFGADGHRAWADVLIQHIKTHKLL
jgi:hypothetical protein